MPLQEIVNPTSPADYDCDRGYQFLKRRPKNGAFNKAKKENCAVSPGCALAPGAYNDAKSFFMTEKCNVSKFPTIGCPTFGQKLSLKSLTRALTRNPRPGQLRQAVRLRPLRLLKVQVPGGVAVPAQTRVAPPVG